ncbi:bile acid:sodium symporter, partial [Psychromonas arctica]
IFITQLLIQSFMGFEGVELELMASIISISKLLLLPMILGELARPLLLKFAQKHKSVFSKVDKFVILLIV